MSGIFAGVFGLLGRRTDPVAQLLEDLPGQDVHQFVEMTDPAQDAARVDHLLVLTQEDALAHFPALLACGKPCRVLLRRAISAEQAHDWETGLAILANAMRSSESQHIKLVALNPEAAAELGQRIDFDVATMPSIPAVEGQVPAVSISRNDPVVTFTVENAQGRRETRRAEHAVYSWNRLRRLCRLIAADHDDFDMIDLVAYSRGVQLGSGSERHKDTERPCIVAVVPNGVGLGHVTRMMAIGKVLERTRDVRLVFWSYSRAAEILQAAGFEVILRQNAVHLKAHPPSWREWETREFAKALKYLNASLVSYDGGNFDPFLIEALRTPGCGRIGVLWVRRGMMRPESDALMLEAEQYCDLVLEPGDLAVEMDIGPTKTGKANHKGFSQTIVTPPLTLKPFLPSYTRRQAKRRLKLGRGRHCLVSLGGAFGDWTRLKALIEEMSARHRVQIIWAQSPLAAPPATTSTNTVTKRFYPLNRYLEAFDGVISATGYNSYHELMLGYDGPVLFAPTNNVRLDDQVARARFAGQQNWADVVLSDDLDDPTDIMENFMRRVRLREKTDLRPRVDLQDDSVADAIFGIIKRYE